MAEHEGPTSNIASEPPKRKPSASSNILGGPLVPNQTPEREASEDSNLTGQKVSSPTQERKPPASGNFFGGTQVSSPTEKVHPRSPASRGSEASSLGSRPDSKLTQSASYPSASLDNTDNRTQTDNTSISARTPVTSKPSAGLQSPHSPTQSTSLTSSVLSSTMPQAQSTAVLPLSGSRSHSPAPGPYSPRFASQTSLLAERPQARISPPPNRTITASPLATPRSSQPPSPPPKTGYATPTVTRQGSPQIPLTATAAQVSSDNSDLANEAGMYALTMRGIAC